MVHTFVVGGNAASHGLPERTHTGAGARCSPGPRGRGRPGWDLERLGSLALKEGMAGASVGPIGRRTVDQELMVTPTVRNDTEWTHEVINEDQVHAKSG